MAAGIWCDDLGLDTLLLEAASEIGGQLHSIYGPISNYLGRYTSNGPELLKLFSEATNRGDFDIWTSAEIDRVDLRAKRIKLRSGEELAAIGIIIATGVRRRQLGIPGESEYVNHGIIESATRDREHFRGKDVCVIGGGDAAVENALLLADVCATVTLVHRSKRLRARREFVQQLQTNHCITVFTESTVTRFLGRDRLEAVEVRRKDGLKPFQIAVAGVLIRIGMEPNSQIFQDQVSRDENGYIIVNGEQETNITNVFAVGDVANPRAPTISGAVGGGATAAKVISSRLTNK
jgi:thioredoxin reductase (NADPH)